jgi:hypothetical protein
MKNPNSASGAGAFRVTETATFASPVSATRPASPATETEQRFIWSPLTHSVEPLRIIKGQVKHG